jgi:hypothetical protein
VSPRHHEVGPFMELRVASCFRPRPRALMQGVARVPPDVEPTASSSRRSSRTTISAISRTRTSTDARSARARRDPTDRGLDPYSDLPRSSSFALAPTGTRDDAQCAVTHDVSHDLQPRPVILRVHPGCRSGQVDSQQRSVAGHVRPTCGEDHASQADLRDDDGAEEAWLAATGERPPPASL